MFKKLHEEWSTIWNSVTMITRFIKSFNSFMVFKVIKIHMSPGKYHWNYRQIYLILLVLNRSIPAQIIAPEKHAPYDSTLLLNLVLIWYHHYHNHKISLSRSQQSENIANIFRQNFWTSFGVLFMISMWHW